MSLPPRPSHGPRAALVLCALATLFALGACGGRDSPRPSPPVEAADPPPGSPSSRGKTPDLVPDLLSPLGGAALSREAVMAVRDAAQRGFDCGWKVGWQQEVKDARTQRASSFRAGAVAGASGLGVAMLLIGCLGLLGVAAFYPALQRAAQLRDPARPTETGEASETTPASRIARALGELARGALRRLSKWLHLEQFDPMRADRWGEALASAFEAERQLRCALRAARRLPGHDSEIAEQCISAVDAWRSELKQWRLTWESEPLPPRDLHPEALAPQLALATRAARDLRIGIAEADARRGKADWRGWLADLAVRPKTPSAAAPTETAPPPWARRAGWAGLGAVGLGLLMAAGWFAAGAVPLVPTAFFLLGGLGAVTAARSELRRAGRERLLPGFADRAARWLATLGGVAATIMVLSSWMSAESGLDLGDPPPIAMPDAAAMAPPDLFAPRAQERPPGGFRPLGLPYEPPTGHEGAPP